MPSRSTCPRRHPRPGAHNVVFVATEHDSVYAFDADSRRPCSGRTASSTRPPASPPSHPGHRYPTSRPSRHHRHARHRPGHRHALRRRQDARTSSDGRHYVMQLHALNIDHGAEKFGGPVTIGDTTLHPDGGFTNDTGLPSPARAPAASMATCSFNALRETHRPGGARQVPAHGVSIAGFAGGQPALQRLARRLRREDDEAGLRLQHRPEWRHGGDLAGRRTRSWTQRRHLRVDGNGTFDAFPNDAVAGGERRRPRLPGILTAWPSASRPTSPGQPQLDGPVLHWLPRHSGLQPGDDFNALAGTGINFAAARSPTPRTPTRRPSRITAPR